MAGSSVSKAAKAKQTAVITKVNDWDEDKAAGGASWARKFLERAEARPKDYKLQGWISDAESLFEGNAAELAAFYDTLQLACLVWRPAPGANPILADTFGDSLNRAQEFAAFLESYTELRVEEGGGALDGEPAGYAMAIGLLNDALMQLNRQRDYADAAPEAQMTT